MQKQHIPTHCHSLSVMGGIRDNGARSIDVLDYLTKNRPSAFALPMPDNAMRGKGIFKGDILLIADNAVKPFDGCLIIALVAGDMIVRIFQKREGGHSLASAHPHYPPIMIDEYSNFRLCGVVRSFMRSLHSTTDKI